MQSDVGAGRPGPRKLRAGHIRERGEVMRRVTVWTHGQAGNDKHHVLYGGSESGTWTNMACELQDDLGMKGGKEYDLYAFGVGDPSGPVVVTREGIIRALGETFTRDCAERCATALLRYVNDGSDESVTLFRGPQPVPVEEGHCVHIEAPGDLGFRRASSGGKTRALIRTDLMVLLGTDAPGTYLVRVTPKPKPKPKAVRPWRVAAGIMCPGCHEVLTDDSTGCLTCEMEFGDPIDLPAPVEVTP
jgi:hypothetical protein